MHEYSEQNPQSGSRAYVGKFKDDKRNGKGTYTGMPACHLKAAQSTARHVRFTLNSGHVRCKEGCPLSANNGHRAIRTTRRRGRTTAAAR
jgi:hypothetical protein